MHSEVPSVLALSPCVWYCVCMSRDVRVGVSAERRREVRMPRAHVTFNLAFSRSLREKPGLG